MFLSDLHNKKNITESKQAVSDYDTWRDQVSAQGGTVHPQKDRVRLVAQSWDGDTIGEFNLRTNQGWFGTQDVAEGKGDFAQAIENLHGWYEEESSNPNIRVWEFDDREGGYYAQGTVYYDVTTGRVKIKFEDRDGYHGGDINDTFNSIGDAMKVLKNITVQIRPNTGKAQNFDKLGGRTLAGPDDLYKTDRTGRKGTLNKSRMDTMKASSPYRKTGPEGQLPESGLQEYSGYGMTETSAQDKLHQRHQEIRKKSGLPHPDHYLKMMKQKQAEIDALQAEIAADKAKGLGEARKPDYNFDIEDIKKLEKIRDLSTLKTLAFELISKPSAKPMKPEKVEWFRSALERMDSPLKVIKLMYDLMLSGEGHQVIGSRNSMKANSYRGRFSEQEGLAEDVERYIEELGRAGYEIVTEAATLCPECGGPAFADQLLAEKQDACYHKVKSRYKVWPSAYASGALVRCRKVGAKNWGNKSKK